MIQFLTLNFISAKVMTYEMFLKQLVCSQVLTLFANQFKKIRMQSLIPHP